MRRKVSAIVDAEFLAGLLDHTALDYVDLPTGHWPMWSRPVELADVIDRAARSCLRSGPGATTAREM